MFPFPAAPTSRRDFLRQTGKRGRIESKAGGVVTITQREVAFGTIDQHSHDAASMAQQIAASAHQQSVGIEQIAGHIATIPGRKNLI